MCHVEARAKRVNDDTTQRIDEFVMCERIFAAYFNGPSEHKIRALSMFARALEPPTDPRLHFYKYLA